MKMATTPQINFAADLATFCFASDPAKMFSLICDLSGLTAVQISGRINWLVDLKATIKKQNLAATPVKNIPVGTYLALGKVVKVKVSKKTGAPYLISQDGEYLGALKGDAPKLLAAIEADPKGCAIAYGKETGNCCICNTELTNPDSIAAGIGPVCAKKF